MLSRRLRAPHSTLERIGQGALRESVYKLLFGQSDGLRVARVLLRAVFGVFSGAGLFLGLMYKFLLTLDLKISVGSIFIALCVIGGVFSSYFRASVLLTFPSMLGSRGRNYLMLFILSALYSGPLSNIQHNMQNVALSLGCNLDLQVNHSRMMWNSTMEPLLQVAQQILDENQGFQGEARDVSRKFQMIRDEVVAQYGYDRFKYNSAANSTQEQFATKTRMQCDGVAEMGISRCTDWFQRKWNKCMKSIGIPVISHILCVSMKFQFLCDIMRVMTPWCREQIPVEGNFGQTFDKLNLSMDLLSREFSTDLVLEEQEQQAILGSFQDHFVTELTAYFQEAQDLSSRILETLQILLSFTFITVFTGAFGYARQYKKDLFFDNVYITTYFRQIDDRRRAAGKHFLLPLNKVQRRDLIDPWHIFIHPSELQELYLALFQVLSLGILASVLVAVDVTLYHMLDILHRNTLSQFNLTSHHSVNIHVGGNSMMARLLRKTITAFNSSSSLDIHTTNQQCVPQPAVLQTMDYVYIIVPILLMVLVCCLQVYTNRLRRVIAAFYFPKWEKRRILFLYNLEVHKQICSTARHRSQLASRGPTQNQAPPWSVLWVLERLGLRLTWCSACGERQRGEESRVTCLSVGCGAAFCLHCWTDLDHTCPCCPPGARQCQGHLSAAPQGPCIA